MYAIEFIVLPNCPHDVILILQFLSRPNALIDCAHAEVEFSVLPDEPAEGNSASSAAKLAAAAGMNIPP